MCSEGSIYHKARGLELDQAARLHGCVAYGSYGCTAAWLRELHGCVADDQELHGSMADDRELRGLDPRRDPGPVFGVRDCAGANMRVDLLACGLDHGGLDP